MNLQKHCRNTEIFYNLLGLAQQDKNNVHLALMTAAGENGWGRQ